MDVMEALKTPSLMKFFSPGSLFLCVWNRWFSHAAKFVSPFLPYSNFLTQQGSDSMRKMEFLVLLTQLAATEAVWGYTDSASHCFLFQGPVIAIYFFLCVILVLLPKTCFGVEIQLNKINICIIIKGKYWCLYKVSVCFLIENFSMVSS